MTRRFLCLLAGALALPLLASCATFDTDDAATVNGTSISNDEIDAVRSTLTESNPAWLDAAGQLNGDLTREALALLIIREVLTQTVADAGLTVSDAELATAADQVSAQLGELPSSIIEPIAYRQAATEKLATVGEPDAATLEAIYSDRPSALGVVCVRLIGAPDQGTANTAAEALRNGTEIPANDGTSDDAGCAAVGDLESAVGSEVAAELVEAEPGHVTGVIEPNAATGATSWQVLQVLPYDEAIDPLAQAFSSTPGQLTATVALLLADVSVDPQYGKWDAGSQAVVPV